MPCRPCPSIWASSPLHGILGGHGLRPIIRPCPKSSQTLPKHLPDLAFSIGEARAGMIISISGAHQYASHGIYAHLTCFCPLLKTRKSTWRHSGEHVDRLCVRLNLKWEDHIKKHKDMPPMPDHPFALLCHTTPMLGSMAEELPLRVQVTSRKQGRHPQIRPRMQVTSVKMGRYPQWAHGGWIAVFAQDVRWQRGFLLTLYSNEESVYRDIRVSDECE